LGALGGLRRHRFVPYRGRRPDKENVMKARVTVTLKSGILDPQGKAIEGALKSLGIAGVASVRQGKVFDIEIEGDNRKEAEAALKQAADKLLANTLVEDYRVDVK
jgi:phosphoribosylformylglycinamidine synthase subunit PurS